MKNVYFVKPPEVSTVALKKITKVTFMELTSETFLQVYIPNSFIKLLFLLLPSLF